MRPPRVRLTVRGMMIAVAIIAVDFGLIRGAEALAVAHSFMIMALVIPAYALVPSLSLLAVAAVSVGLGLVKRGQSPPFSTGYLLVGGLISFGMCLALATQVYYMLFAVTARTPDPIQGPSLWEVALGCALEIAIYALPQVVPALIGGALAARYGLTIARGGRATSPEVS